MIDHKPMTLTFALVLMLGSGATFAQNSDQNSDQNSKNSDGDTMSICEVVTSLKDRGYTGINRIDRDLDRYEINATDPDGTRVYMIVDGTNGDLLTTESQED